MSRFSRKGEAGDIEMREISAQPGAKLASGRSNAPPSSLVAGDNDSIQGANGHQSAGKRAANAPRPSSRLPSKNLRKEEESMGEIRSNLLVVAALIASTTYQAVLQPPSFLTKVDNDSTKGFQGYYASWITGPLGRDFAYIVFMSGNTLGFLVSVQMIICLTRDLPVRLLLLLSMAALVQTYCCFTYYLPFTLLDKAFGLKNVELLSMLPVTISMLFLLAQRQLALALDYCLKRLSQLSLLGDMYSLRAQPFCVNDGEIGEIHTRAEAERKREISNSPASRPLSEEDRSDGEPVTNAPQSLSGSPSTNLTKEKESLGDIRNALLVIAALIATTTYQAVLQPPSFTIKANDSSMKGFLASYSSWVTHPLGRDMAYIGFITGNTFGFLLSIQMIICLTKDLRVRLPLLLSMAALVQTYCCFTYYLPFTLLDKAFGLKNVELLSMLPVTMSMLLLLAQRQLALALDYWLKRLSQFNLLEDMYSLRPQPSIVNDREFGEIRTQAEAKRKRERSNSPSWRLPLEKDQSKGEPVASLNILNEESIGDIRNALLVVATLIASATYQVALQPPSFKIKVDHNSTKGFLAYYASWVTSPLSRDIAYIGFICGNTFGLLVSIQMIICLTRDLRVRLPLLLSMTALVQSYYCFTYYLPFTLLDKASGLKNVELLSVLPVTMSVLLLLAQRQLALALDHGVERLSQFNFLGDMYDLRTQSTVFHDREMRDILKQAGSKQGKGRSNSPASLFSVEDQSDWEPVPNSNALIREEESIGNIRNALLAVATLIVSTTYQSVIQPPSFTVKVNDNSTEGFLAYYASWVTCPLGRDIAYIGFISGNTFGLLLSIQMIICLTRYFPVRLPLLLSMTALVQTYCCFTYYLPFTLLDKAFGLKNVELLSVLPVTMSVLLLLAQRQLALALDCGVERLSQFKFLGDMYSLRPQHKRERSNSPAPRLPSEEDPSDGEPVTNAPQSLSRSPSNNLNKEKETLGDIRNALLVIAALITSATYQAMLQPPSFTRKVDRSSTKGFLASYASWMTDPLGRDLAYVAFMSSNTFGFLVSVQIIICLTRDLRVKLPLLLALATMVQTYYCFAYYLPFTFLDKAFGLENVELLSVLPLMISILLLSIQRWVALALDFYFERLFQFNILGDMYSMKT